MTGMPPLANHSTLPATQTIPLASDADKTKPKATPKFRLASDLSEQLPVDSVGGKMLDAPVQLTFREVLSVSGELAGYIHEQTRRKRIPLTPANSSSANSTRPEIPSVNVSLTSATHNEWEKSYYALPSGRALANIGGKGNVTALLDNGSKVNLIPKRIFDTLDYPIDTNISWRINGYDQKTQDHLHESGVFGVLHGCPIEIGGLTVKQHVFVVQSSGADLLLGRPFERATRATYINEDDGSMVVILRSQDGQQEVMFTAVKGRHERNREFVCEKNAFQTSVNAVEMDETKEDLKG